MLILLALAAFGGEPSSDIVVTQRLQAAPATVFEHMLDVRNVQTAAPDDCMRNWTFGSRTEGLGAQFRLVYAMEGWRRRLNVSVVAADAGRRIEWDHHGNRGFITRFTFEPSDGGTQVTIHTYLSAPPWPFRRYYANKVQPAWESCYRDLLDNVGAILGESPGAR